MVSLFKKIGATLYEPLNKRHFTVTAPLADFTNNSKFCVLTLTGTTEGQINLPEGVTGIELETEKSDIVISLEETPGDDTATVAIASHADASWENGVILPSDKRVSYTVGGARVLKVKPGTGGTLTVHVF